MLTSVHNCGKSIEILQLILSSKKLFLKFATNKENIPNLFIALVDISIKHQDMRCKIYICLTRILAENPFIAQHINTVLFIKIQCSLEVNDSWYEFIKFLNLWINIMKTTRLERKIFVVQYIEIATYLHRIDYLAEKKVSRYLKV